MARPLLNPPRMEWRKRETPKARRLRTNATSTEQLLWPWVRNRRLLGWKFRRQHPVGPYIVDLACVEAMLIVELDGAGHFLRADEDAKRQAFLERAGWRVLRFGNHEAVCELHSVIETIVSALGRACSESDSPHPDPLPRGRGG
ncbi:MAG: DUF559 domain-containing protein [Myxococcaceae bacterium]